MKSAVGPVRGSGEEDSLASALGHGSGLFTDGQRPVWLGQGKEAWGGERPPMPFALGFGRLSRCLILMAFFSGCPRVFAYPECWQLEGC